MAFFFVLFHHFLFSFFFSFFSFFSSFLRTVNFPPSTFAGEKVRDDSKSE